MLRLHANGQVHILPYNKFTGRYGTIYAMSLLPTMKHSLQSARGKTAYKSTATAGLEAELQVQDLKRRCKGGGGKETGVGLGESSQGLQRREVTMQATGGEERVL